MSTRARNMIGIPDDEILAARATVGDRRDVVDVLIPAEALMRRVRNLGIEIAHDFAGREPVLIPVLQGALMFTADLMRSIDQRLQVACVTASSYPSGDRRAAELTLTTDLELDLSGRDIIIVEDIVDTGRTVQALLDQLRTRDPASLSIATCLSKPARREMPVQLRYVGFDVPDVFVVGYGLDWSGRYRNLPYVGVLNETAALEE